MSEIKIGLSLDEIQAILSDTIKAGEGLSAEKLTSAIAKAIHENNVKLAHDVSVLTVMLGK